MSNKVLVTGASGLLGVAAIEKFLSAGWEVIGVSRRKPELPSDREIEFLSVDLQDRDAARAAFEPLTGITHIAYTALHEKPDLVAGWSSKDQIETNNAMLRNVVEPILLGTNDFQHISILQGTKVYGVHLHPIPIPARESDPRDPHDELLLGSRRLRPRVGRQARLQLHGTAPATSHRPHARRIECASAIGVYAAIQRERAPFRFPGGPSFVWEAADADLVANVIVSAAGSPRAANEAFNITNGDVLVAECLAHVRHNPRRRPDRIRR